MAVGRSPQSDLTDGKRDEAGDSAGPASGAGGDPPSSGAELSHGRPGLPHETTRRGANAPGGVDRVGRTLFSSQHQHALHRLALVQMAVILLIVLTALPVVFRSMSTQLTQGEEEALFAFPGGALITETSADDETRPHSYFNIAAVDFDEVAGSITLAISGHRDCQDTCPYVTVKMVSLNDDEHHRRALPPSATIELTPDMDIFTQTVQLPLQGQPSLYPFDSYALWLGLAGTVDENGQRVELTPQLVADHAMITTQDQLRAFDMARPFAIDPGRVGTDSDPLDFFGIQELRFDRPVHLKILTALLISLVAASAIVAVAMRDIRDLVFSMGSLIIAIWGIRSVLTPQALNVTTSIDLALLLIILLVLLGLTARAAWSFGASAEVPALLHWWRTRSD